MDRDTFIVFKILEVLNRARKEKGEFTRVNLKDIADELSMDFRFFRKRYENELYNLGYIVPDSGGDAYITKQGVAMIEKNNPLYQSFKNVENKNITIGGSVINSSIVQGDENYLNITFDFFTKLEKEIESSSLSQEEKKTWCSKIKEASHHPIIASLVANVLLSFIK